MDLSYAGYLLFAVPGFFLVWTYRRFTNAPRMGEFEYAAWSFFWGVPQFLLFGAILSWQHVSLPPVPLNDPGAVLGSLAGTSFGLVICSAFLFGFLGALLSHVGLFGWIEQKLSKLLKALAHDIRK